MNCSSVGYNQQNSIAAIALKNRQESQKQEKASVTPAQNTENNYSNVFGTKSEIVSTSLNAYTTELSCNAERTRLEQNTLNTLWNEYENISIDEYDGNTLAYEEAKQTAFERYKEQYQTIKENKREDATTMTNNVTTIVDSCANFCNSPDGIALSFIV